jgi:hypothetical protein
MSSFDTDSRSSDRWEAKDVAFDGGRWNRVSPHLDHALELTPAERRTWLTLLRSEDPELADDLEGMLEDHRSLSAAGFLDDGARCQVLRGPEALEGARVGATR